MARKAISDKSCLIDLRKAGLPRSIASSQKREIAKMERLLRNVEAAGHGAETVSRVRQSIKAAIGSGQFQHFIETTEAQDGYQWPVATIAAATLRKMGLPDDVRVLRLDSRGGAKGQHRDRYMTFKDEWHILQAVINRGESMPIRDAHGAVWHQAADGKWWVVIIGYGEALGVFLETTFAPTSGRNYIDNQIPKWKEYAAEQRLD